MGAVDADNRAAVESCNGVMPHAITIHHKKGPDAGGNPAGLKRDFRRETRNIEPHTRQVPHWSFAARRATASPN